MSADHAAFTTEQLVEIAVELERYKNATPSLPWPSSTIAGLLGTIDDLRAEVLAVTNAARDELQRRNEATKQRDTLRAELDAAVAELVHINRRADRAKESRDNYAAAFSKAVAERDAAVERAKCAESECFAITGEVGDLERQRLKLRELVVVAVDSGRSLGGAAFGCVSTPEKAAVFNSVAHERAELLLARFDLEWKETHE